MSAKRMETDRPAPLAVCGASRQYGWIHAATKMIINATPVMTIDLRLDSLDNSCEMMIVAIVRNDNDAVKALSP